MLIYNYTPDFIFLAGLLCGEGPAKNEFRIQNPEGPEKKGPESGLPIHTNIANFYFGGDTHLYTLLTYKK